MGGGRRLPGVRLLMVCAIGVMTSLTACPRTTEEAEDPIGSPVEQELEPSTAATRASRELATYRNEVYGFSFRYPSRWELVEGQNFVGLSYGSIHLVIGYRHTVEEPNICRWDDLPEGDLVAVGTVRCSGEDIGKAVVQRSERTKAVVYGDNEEIGIGDLMFLFYLGDFAADYEAADIPEDVQDEMDGVIESLATFEVAHHRAAITPVPTRLPDTPQPTRATIARAPRTPLPRLAMAHTRLNGAPVEPVSTGVAETATAEAETLDADPEIADDEPETAGPAVAEAGPRGALARSGPGPSYDILGVLGPGERAEITGRYVNWWRVVFQGNPAWVYNETVRAANVAEVPVVDPERIVERDPETTEVPAPPSGPETPVAGTAIAEAQPGGANLRTGPAFRFNRKGFLQAGERVEITARHEDWWQVTYEGSPAWVYSGVVRALGAEHVPQAVAVPTLVPRIPEVVPPPAPPEAIDEERWIDVSLSEQRLRAYENGEMVRTTLVSTGRAHTPTPTGQFRIWIKLRYDTMSGPGYHLPNVPYAMYFYGCYGMHGTYWHSNFGHPMSAGCVNLPTPEAAWVYDFVDIGTLVNVRP